MNSASAWRRQLARELASSYAAREPVRMVLLGGSAARGTADAFSDLDLVVVWDRVDGEWLDGVPLAARAGRRFTYLQTDERGSRLEQYMLGTLKIDVANVAAASIESTLDRVLDACDTDGSDLKTLAVLADCTALHGAEAFVPWERRIRDFPVGLAAALVAKHLAFFPRWVPERLALDRGDALGFYDYLGRGARNVLGILAALNGVYYASDGEQKGTSDLVAKLARSPSRLEERIRAVFERPPAAGLDELYALIEETLDQLEAELPSVNAKRVRSILALPLERTDRSPL